MSPQLLSIVASSNPKLCYYIQACRNEKVRKEVAAAIIKGEDQVFFVCRLICYPFSWRETVETTINSAYLTLICNIIIVPSYTTFKSYYQQRGCKVSRCPHTKCSCAIFRSVSIAAQNNNGQDLIIFVQEDILMHYYLFTIKMSSVDGFALPPGHTHESLGLSKADDKK